MHNRNRCLLLETRRQFFNCCGVGVGKIALASLLTDGAIFANKTLKGASPGAPKQPHFPAKVKNIIYLFMAGGPSQLDLFDYKPKLQEWDGKPTPDSYFEGKRFAFMDSFAKDVPKLFGTRRKFKRHGRNGLWVSELLPHTASVIDELAIISGIATENFNHAPAKIFANTGSTRFGRPSMGAWVTYGLGSESRELPGFVVLQSGGRGPRGGALNWGSGFLPSTYQGVAFRSTGDPILNLSSPEGVTARLQGQTLDVLRELNKTRLEKTGDAEIATRISSYEMAFRMQTSGPELIDFSSESQKTLEMYGVEPDAGSFANNCLLARRLVEQGARFVQLYHADWDHHGKIAERLDQVCVEIDRPIAALIRDLKQRGLLDETLVVWGGEFGRTPMAQNYEDEKKAGRNHHIDASTMWMAGGGIRPGQMVGETDELGFTQVDDRIGMHDIHATILHLLGLDHTKLTFKFQGRDFRLTDVGGKVIQELLA